MTTGQYARLVGEWVAGIGLDASKFGTLYGFNTSAPGAASSSQALTVMASIT